MFTKYHLISSILLLTFCISGVAQDYDAIPKKNANGEVVYGSTAFSIIAFYSLGEKKLIYTSDNKLVLLNKENTIISINKVKLKGIQEPKFRPLENNEKLIFTNFQEKSSLYVFNKEGEVTTQISPKSKTKKVVNYIEIPINKSNNIYISATHSYPQPNNHLSKWVILHKGSKEDTLYKFVNKRRHTNISNVSLGIDVIYFKDKIYVFDADEKKIQIHNLNGEVLKTYDFHRQLKSNMLNLYIDDANGKLYIGTFQGQLYYVAQDDTLYESSLSIVGYSIHQIQDNTVYFSLKEGNQYHVYKRNIY